jgi:hypothetical protein
MKNPLADLEHRTLAALPGVSIKRARMAAPERVDAFDVRRGDRMVAVLWTVADGFCIADVNDDSVLDDSPDFVVRSVDEALQSLMFLLDTAELRDMDGADAPARWAA